MSPSPVPPWSGPLLDVLMRGALIVVLTLFCYRVFRPFIDLLLWSLILAVTLYPLHGWLLARLGNRNGQAATLIVLVCVAALLIPAYLLGASLTESVQNTVATIKSGAFAIPPPADSVANWPLIGERLHAVWQQAAVNLSGALQQLAPKVREHALGILGTLAGMGAAMLIFIGALITAGIIMAFGVEGHRSARRIAARIVGTQQGERVVVLCTATIRAVALGVIGIAFIQMLLVGIPFVIMGIPGAGLLALAILLLGIMQVPVTIITVPVIAFVIVTQGASVETITFAVWTLIAGLSDNVLKPLLLGRGLEVPMPVVLIGAIGGMVDSGVIGLFIGPVVLAVAYRLFWEWVGNGAVVSERSAGD
ncbi:AI-2E family transporter [Pseudomonas sp. MAP12]|uniref:AI-2E family transporter n=1 Tax=Geopseudomonas aromaticivorans TaxID=2849492 RepID=A0ABS6N0R7_9GAMM|nr:AI-2E family transporter [Pseudomonas aromaticivorans]MBV2134646.1 AI-2E family transporter [Pseudomonas aromaticivorans]